MKYKILIVDDDMAMINLFVLFLRASKNYNIITAMSGEDALHKIKLDPPDLILLDVEMPGMNGIETCKKITSNPAWSDIPILMVTANDSKKLINIFEQKNIGYIKKPIDKMKLKIIIKSTLHLMD